VSRGGQKEGREDTQVKGKGGGQWLGGCEKGVKWKALQFLGGWGLGGRMRKSKGTVINAVNEWWGIRNIIGRVD